MFADVTRCAIPVASTRRPCSTTPSVGALGAGSSENCEFRVRVTTTGPITNTATVSGSPADPGGSDADSVTVTAGAADFTSVPALDMAGLILLSVLLAMAGLWVVTRFR